MQTAHSPSQSMTTTIGHATPPKTQKSHPNHPNQTEPVTTRATATRDGCAILTSELTDSAKLAPTRQAFRSVTTQTFSTSRDSPNASTFVFPKIPMLKSSSTDLCRLGKTYAKSFTAISIFRTHSDCSLNNKIMNKIIFVFIIHVGSSPAGSGNLYRPLAAKLRQ